jgi:LCP family protein required for cell wall assembly
MTRAVSPSSRTHRTWFERLAIGAAITAAVLAFLAAVGLTAGYYVVTSRQVVSIDNPADAAGAGQSGAAPAPLTPPSAPEVTTPASAPEPEATSAPTVEVTTAPTFPEADPEASNFLLTGADNGACVDPNSPYAAAFGDREGMGERSDTIMVFRVDPATSRVAVLSFPRDLYVEIADTGNRARINSAFRRDEPQRLINTIYENFGIGIDHFIQVDFCAFKTLVDAVGGVSVPFDFPARDPNTGLNVPTTGCFAFDGEHALAYVRSRHYEYEYPPGSGEWHDDETSDLGRISRQQDFLRRVLSSVLSRGPLNPSVAGALIESAQNYVVTDNELSPAKLLEFAGVLNRVEPGAIPTYQIEATDRSVNGASVLEPALGGENMQQILGLFRGERSLGEAPDQQFASTTTPPTRPGQPTGSEATTPPRSDDGDGADGADGAETSGTEPATTPLDPSQTTVVTVPGAPAENTMGIVPPRGVSC